MKVDFHMHTSNSDGHFSTKELLTLCEDKDIKLISITDHDSVKSYYDIEEQNLTFGGTIINGVELSFGDHGRLFDMLGYNIDIDIMNEWLNKTYTESQRIKNQEKILVDMKTLYSRLGIKFDNNLKITKGLKSEAYNLMKQSVLRHEENKILFPEFWEKNFYKHHHTNVSSKFYVDETSLCPTIKEVVDIIHKANGVAILAHSGAYGFSDVEMSKFIENAISSGVDGLELKYNSHTPQHEKIITRYANKHNLLLSGGSDYHGGAVKPHVQLGMVYDSQMLTDEDIKEFVNYIIKSN